MKNGGYFTLFPLALQVALTGNVYQHAYRYERRHQIRASIAYERQSQPLGGQKPRHNPHVEHGLKENQERHSESDELAETVAGLDGNDDPTYENRHKKHQKQQ